MGRSVLPKFGLCFVVVLSIGAPAGACGVAESGGASSWKVGLARADITPQKAIWMAGYAARNKPSEGVLAPLYAVVMALEDGEGNSAVLVTSDVIGLRKEVAQVAVQRIMERTGLPRDRILLNWSHTHTGPVLGFKGSAGYGLDETQQEVVDEYTRGLIDQYADLSAAALAQMEPARLAWGVGVVNFPMNRREFTENGVRLGVNPRGYADRSVPILAVYRENGDLRAVVFGCACHNTTLTQQHYQISGDYAGFARAYIEEHLPGVQGLFLIGCAADINPYPREEVEHALRHGEELGREVCRLLQTKLRPVAGPLKTTSREVELPLAPPPPRESLTAMTRGPSYLAPTAQRMLEILERGEQPASSYRAPFVVWQFGEDLTLVALPGEVVSDYVPLIEGAIGHLRLWVAAYCNEVFGYLPSARVVREGGYETRGITPLGFFPPEVENVVVENVREMAVSVGRPSLP